MKNTSNQGNENLPKKPSNKTCKGSCKSCICRTTEKVAQALSEQESDQKKKKEKE